MALIEEYPIRINSKRLLQFLDTVPFSVDGGYKGQVMKTSGYGFLEHNVPIIRHLRQSFYKSCSKYLGMKTTDWKIKSWVYADWEDNQNNINAKGVSGPYLHSHNDDNPYAVSAIMYLTLPGASETTMFPMPRENYFLPKRLFTWFIFPSRLPHLPGKGKDKKKRYCLSADLYP